jgi:hypothetical protein
MVISDELTSVNVSRESAIHQHMYEGVSVGVSWQISVFRSLQLKDQFLSTVVSLFGYGQN